MSDPKASHGRGSAKGEPSPSDGIPSPSIRVHATAFDAGEGDISLSRTGSQSTPPVSAFLGHIQGRTPDPAPLTSSNRRDVTSPVPQRLMQQRWTSTVGASAHQQRTASAALPDLAKGGSPSHGPRNSTSTMSSPAPSPNKSEERATNNEGLTAPSTGRRGITRSRSLNVRIPSVDLSGKAGFQDTASATAVEPSGPWDREQAEDDDTPIEKPMASPRPPPLVDSEVAKAMSRWVKEIVVCNFDLERGPVVERRAVGRRWRPGEKENV